MKIATWNLDYCRADGIREQMASVGADIWVLTETLPTCSPGKEYLLVACSPPHNCRTDKPDARFVAIWIRDALQVASWTAEERRVLPVHEQRMACIRMTHPEQDDIVVVGTVLPYPGDPLYGSGDAGYCAALASQSVEWEYLRGGQHSDLCVAGDFNQSLPYVRYFGSRSRAKALKEAIESLKLSSVTENADNLGDPYIDHIFISKAFQRVGSLNCWPKGKYGTCSTDHAGVCADLTRT